MKTESSPLLPFLWAGIAAIIAVVPLNALGQGVPVSFFFAFEPTFDETIRQGISAFDHVFGFPTTGCRTEEDLNQPVAARNALPIIAQKILKREWERGKKDN